MKMERVVAGTPNERAIITRELTIRTAPVKRHPAYATRLILCVPCPRSHRMPLKNLDLHCVTFQKMTPLFSLLNPIQLFWATTLMAIFYRSARDLSLRASLEDGAVQPGVARAGDARSGEMEVSGGGGGSVWTARQRDPTAQRRRVARVVRPARIAVSTREAWSSLVAVREC